MNTSEAARAVTGIAWQRLSFTYDYQGRRVEKKVSSTIDGANFTASLQRRFVYDGWNLIGEFNYLAGNTLVRSYAWGLDLTGSLSRSAGVGALLQMTNHTAGQTYWATYDGNGNVASLVNSSTGVLAAAYEYDPFGNPLRSEVREAAATDNPFRFSTKYHDAETGLVYYGFRYYSSSLGRFINRDPIGERGGINLFEFVGNDGVNRWEFLGLIWVKRPVWCTYSYLESADGSRSHFQKTCEYTLVYIADGNDGGRSPSSHLGGPVNGPSTDPTQTPTAAPNNKPDEKKEWKPNKKDCDELRGQYSGLFTRPNTATDGLLYVTMAATIAVGAETADYRFEHYTTIYRTQDGQFGYTTPRPVMGRAVGGGITFNNPPGTTLVAAAHGHNVGFLTYWTFNQGATEPIYMALSSLFSPADQNAALQPGMPTVLIYTQSDTMRAFSAKTYLPSPRANHPGHEVPGSPPTETLNKIRQCVSSGL